MGSLLLPADGAAGAAPGGESGRSLEGDSRRPGQALARAVGQDRRRPGGRRRAVLADRRSSAARRGTRALPITRRVHPRRRHPHKNLKGLLEAFALAREWIPHTLFLVGESHDHYHDDVPETAARLGLADRLHAAGHVPDEDLAALYSGAMCAAIVSFHEGFGMPALEALACSASPIVSDRDSLPEIASGKVIVLNQ